MSRRSQPNSSVLPSVFASSETVGFHSSLAMVGADGSGACLAPSSLLVEQAHT